MARRHAVRVVCYDGERDVEAWPTETPGLVAHRTIVDDGAIEEWALWSITHERSTLNVCCVPSAEAALGCARALGEVADWTRRGADLARRDVARRVSDIADEWGGGMGCNRADGLPIRDEARGR
jgi:hypothetical protein